MRVSSFEDAASQNQFPALQPPFILTCDPPFLVAQFEAPQTVLSWAMTRPGFQVAQTVAWLEVKNSDLTPTVDPFVFLDQHMARAGLSDAVALMTSRDVRNHHVAMSKVDGIQATCLATVGLSNGSRVGLPRAEIPIAIGTINLLVHVSCALTESALIETVSIATQARTVAILGLDHRSHGYVVSGTGTDCIVVAAPSSGQSERFAGLHTAIGEAVGRAVHDAVSTGGSLWCRQQASTILGHPRHPQGKDTAY